jgi:hypothetical protein
VIGRDACYASLVHSGSLTTDQLRRLQFAVRKHAAYFAALSGRVSQKYFPRDDPLRIAVDDAMEAAEKLRVEVDRLTKERIAADQKSPY